MADGSKNTGTVAAAQSILGVCRNIFNSPPKPGEARVYLASLHLSWKAFGKIKRNDKIIKYEIAYRFDDQAKSGVRKPTLSGTATKVLTSGVALSRVPFYTPPDYVEKLLKIEPRHTARPNWETFDFSGPISMLSAWLATLTWHPKATLSELCDLTNIRVVPLTTLEESAALSSHAVFISQNVMGIGRSNGFWTLAAACGSFGVAVATDHCVVLTSDSPRYYNLGGPVLWRGIIDGLRVLAELYDRAGVGEAFAFAMVKGIHSVNTVVSHSDEGGLTRDILRECRFQTPFGGLPPDCPLSACLPTVTDSASYSSLVTIVDGLSLLTAAAVAHVAPVVKLDSGSTRPFVVLGKMTERVRNGVKPLVEGDKAEQARHMSEIAAYRRELAEHIDAIRPALTDGYAEFAGRYFKALAKILHLSSCADEWTTYYDWMCQATHITLLEHNNRHLTKNEALAPFFWVEPTGILSRNWCGGPAEEGGWGSYAGPGEVRRERMFPDIVECDIPSACHRNYEIDFEGARKCLWITCLANHKDDGLAQIHFKRLDPGALCQLGGNAARAGPASAFAGRYPIADYLWTRGQSQLVHPAECINMFDRAVVVINHFKPATDSWLAAVPCRMEIEDAMVELWTTPPEGLTCAPVGHESRREAMVRTRGQEALSAMVSRLNADNPSMLTEGGYLTVGIVRRKPGERVETTIPTNKAPPHNRTSPDSQHDLSGSSNLVAGKAQEVENVKSGTVSARLNPTLVGGAHIGPRLPPATSGQAGVGGPPTHPERGAHSLPSHSGIEDGHGLEGAVPAQP